MAGVTISREGDAARGRYVGRVQGNADEAELTFTRPEPGVLLAIHTGVPESMRGTGAGKALVERLVADARAEGFKIRIRCPFVKAQFERHPEWAGLKG
jgi:uncharacterized protein